MAPRFEEDGCTIPKPGRRDRKPGIEIAEPCLAGDLGHERGERFGLVTRGPEDPTQCLTR